MAQNRKLPVQEIYKHIKNKKHLSVEKENLLAFFYASEKDVGSYVHFT